MKFWQIRNVFKFVYKKVIKNWRLFISLLIGFILTTSIIVSVPMFTSAIFEKVLVNDLDTLKSKNQIYPGILFWREKYFS